METSPIADSAQDSDGHWVVVFGFPPSHSAQILSIFSQVSLNIIVCFNLISKIKNCLYLTLN